MARGSPVHWHGRDLRFAPAVQGSPSHWYCGYLWSHRRGRDVGSTGRRGNLRSYRNGRYLTPHCSTGISGRAGGVGTSGRITGGAAGQGCAAGSTARAGSVARAPREFRPRPFNVITAGEGLPQLASTRDRAQSAHRPVPAGLARSAGPARRTCALCAGRITCAEARALIRPATIGGWTQVATRNHALISGLGESGCPCVRWHVARRRVGRRASVAGCETGSWASVGRPGILARINAHDQRTHGRSGCNTPYVFQSDRHAPWPAARVARELHVPGVWRRPARQQEVVA